MERMKPLLFCMAGLVETSQIVPRLKQWTPDIIPLVQSIFYTQMKKVVSCEYDRLSIGFCAPGTPGIILVWNCR